MMLHTSAFLVEDAGERDSLRIVDGVVGSRRTLEGASRGVDGMGVDASIGKGGAITAPNGRQTWCGDVAVMNYQHVCSFGRRVYGQRGNSR